jgi:protein SCO1/2
VAVRGKTVVLLVLATIVVAATAILVPSLLARRSPPPPLPKLGPLPASFTLIDHTGAAVTPETLRGKVIIADFVFTRCDTICPVLSMKMRRVQDQTMDVADQVKLISFSVDPAHDTPAELATYAARFHADDTRWRFATSPRGDKADLAPIAQALMSPMEEAGTTSSGAPNIVHSNYFFLIDKHLELRAFYDAEDAPKMEKMLIQARRLAREP